MDALPVGAGTLGACVAVIAIQLDPCLAIAQLADVADGARIAIIAGGRIEGVEAADLWVTVVVGAEVIVVAVERYPRFAEALPALVVERAWIAVVAIARRRFEFANAGLA